MKRQLLALLACAAALAGCGARTPPIAQVPAIVQDADADLKAAAVKALRIVVAADRVADTLSLIEDQASKEGVVPAPADHTFDTLIVAYADASDAAVAKLGAGIASWDAAKAVLDPVLARANQLVDLVKSMGQAKSFLGSIVDALKALAVEALNAWGEYAFGGSR